MKKIPERQVPGLWRFALACYARPGVEAACLALQEQGADICLLLCGAWLESRATACTPERIEALRAMAAPWQQAVVAPLRQLRRQWKPASTGDPALAALRDRLKQLELDAERLLLARLEDVCRAWDDKQPAADWLAELSPPAAGRATLQILRDAAHQAQLAPGSD